MKYLLDTHAVVWLLSSQTSKLPYHLAESVSYCEDDFYVSEVSLLEIVQLQQGGRVDLNYRPSSVRDRIAANSVGILRAAPDIMEQFFDLPVPVINGNRHSDPFDRLIIASAIRRDFILVSADKKFPWYRDHCGLQLYEI